MYTMYKVAEYIQWKHMQKHSNVCHAVKLVTIIPTLIVPDSHTVLHEDTANTKYSDRKLIIVAEIFFNYVNFMLYTIFWNKLW